MLEIWKDIPNYEGLYQASNLGFIKNVKTNRVLKPRVDKNGYFKHILYIKGVPKEFRTHRLIALTFIENPDNLPQVNHVDEDKQNNCVDNLEWVDAKTNNNHASRNKRIAIGVRNSSKKKPVNQYDLNGNFIKTWESLREIERELNIGHSNLSLAIKQKNGIMKNYKWEFV
jgi:hypothetical protein